MNTRNLLIYGGALLTILGLSLFQEHMWVKYALLSGGVILVLVGLLKKERKDQGAE